VVTVEDTGTGMSAEILDRIFEPFFTTKEAGHGTGLGLPTSLAIVRSHGGALRVRSAPGAGSCFTIALPVAPVSAIRAKGKATSGLASGHGELVLVVDDESAIRAVTARLLERSGYRVVAAESGEEALVHFGEHGAAIDLVLTDLMMPGMDGAALLHALRALGATAPVIAVTGLSAGAGEEQVEGAVAVLAKPYTASELLEAVARAIGGARSEEREARSE
jgi:CheY-like chemotaxis protein